MKLPEFNWQDGIRIILTLAAAGFVWTQENQMALMALLAMVIVWLVKVYAFWRKKSVGKLELTIALLAVSVGLSLIFKPVFLPAWPIFEGDAVLYISAILKWIAEVVALGGSVFAFATGLYNILMAQVLAKVEVKTLKKLHVRG